MVSFLLRVEADPQDAAIAACEVPVICLGTDAASPEIDVGRAVAITGALTERRWKGPAGTTRRRFEVLARAVRPLAT